MGVDVDLCRARIGAFCSTARVLSRKLSFLSIETLLPFCVLRYYRGPNLLALSVFVHTFWYLFDSLAHKQNNLGKTAKGKPKSSVADYLFKPLHDMFSFFHNTLLLMSGDIEQNPGPLSTLENVSICHVNACSVRNKISLFEAESDHFDIITVSETWLSDRDDDASLGLKNFHLPIRLDRPGDAHGGVAIYVRNSLTCKPRPDLHVPGLEAVWVETAVKNQPLLVGSFYRPPNALVSYWDLISESISKANDDLKKFVILGDFNTDWTVSPSKHLIDILNLYHLHQLITQPTRITANSSTCIDFIITQSPEIVKSVDVSAPFCSDHSVPFVVLDCKSMKKFRFVRTIYNYDKLDTDKFTDLLKAEQWQTIFNEYEIDDSCKLFTKTFFEIAKLCMPVKQVTVSSKDALWLNNNIRTMLKRRNKLYKKAKRTNNVNHWLQFRQYRNYVIEQIRLRKQNYIDEMNENICNSDMFGTKQWWKLVNSFMAQKGMHTDTIPPIMLDGKLYESNQDKANIFNDFFVEQTKLNSPDDPLPPIELSESELQDVNVLASDVKTIILNLKKNKAVGPDEIHNKLLIYAADVISEPLAIFFNRCLAEGKFPTDWKLAYVTPIHKKGEREICSNYRPISLLSCVGKIFERCIHKYVYEFLMLNNLITETQSGFMAGDSTTNQLLSIYENMCLNYDLNITTHQIYFDISKAFDRVWHRGLIHKLEAIGIRGNLLKWFENYLNERKQIVVIKNEKSYSKTIQAGVPQGSVLGPLLFLIYINDIVKNIDSVIKLFADDTSMSYGSANNVVRAQVINQDLQKIEQWSKTWKIKFNDSKTEMLTIKRDNNPTLPLYFGNLQLSESESHKHLGIILQNNCKWNEYIFCVASKVKLLTNCLKSFKHILNRKSLETMYKSFVLPIFDYADVLYDNCTQAQGNLLEDLHLDALRTITGLVRGTSHAVLYAETGQCSLRKRRERHKLLLYFKMVNDMVPHYLKSLLPPLVSDINPYHRRRPLERSLPPYNTELFRTSYISSTTTLWNSLPEYVQRMNSISAFKRYLITNDSVVPSYYYFGKRTEQVLHCRLRQNMSDLNNDLFLRHLSLDPTCDCGYQFETAKHYLLDCPNYNDIRINSILDIKEEHRKVDVLLFGSSALTVKENEAIVLHVHNFIRLSNRFT